MSMELMVKAMKIRVGNGRDERGQFASYDVVDDVRQMLFKALLGWNG
ncbi:hypothetical protein P5Q82_004895 [Escherichia coli]|nr:hypothetical protein [Escherichia coli]